VARSARGARRQAQGPRVRLTVRLLAGIAAGAACANVGDPPGGPPDAAPPVILSVAPDSGAIVPDLRDAAEIRFDEVIEEVPGMAGGAGGAGFAGGGIAGGASRSGGLASFVVLSPVRGEVRVSWHRSAIRVKPREGWVAGRVYRLELLPGISDLRRNRTEAGRIIVFSTGPALPNASLAGRAVLWSEQRALVRGLIIAAPVPDTIGYLAYTDSTGHFRLDGIPAGSYMVYAVDDGNGNRSRDRREAYDSVPVTIDSSASVVLWAFAHDTAGPRLRQAELVDSLALRLIFSQPLAVSRVIDAEQVAIVTLPDSIPHPVRDVLATAAYDSLVAHARAAADSARQAAPDSLAREAKDTATARGPAAPPGKQPPALRPGGPAPVAAAPDTALRQLLATRPVPSDRRIVRLEQPLTPGTRYLVRVSAAVNLNGATGDGQAVFEVPAPAPADTTARADSLSAPRDTTSRP